jgi:hypothetical protein
VGRGFSRDINFTGKNSITPVIPSGAGRLLFLAFTSCERVGLRRGELCAMARFLLDGSLCDLSDELHLAYTQSSRKFKFNSTQAQLS